MATSYLLDTNILVHYVRSDFTWVTIRNRFSLFIATSVPFLSVTSHGEIRSLAKKFLWGPKRRDLMEFALGYFQKVSIDLPEILEAYAEVDFDCRSRGFTLGKNDLWIAATAVATGATLLSTDRDFDRVNPALLLWMWVDPTVRKSA